MNLVIICFLIWIIIAFISSLFIIHVIKSHEFSKLQLGFFLFLVVCLFVSSLICYISINKEVFTSIGVEFFSRLFLGMISSTLPSTGVMFLTWYIIIGRGKTENELRYVAFYPLAALIIFTFIFGPIMTTNHFVLHYVLSISLTVISVGVVITLRILFGSCTYDESEGY